MKWDGCKDWLNNMEKNKSNVATNRWWLKGDCGSFVKNMVNIFAKKKNQLFLLLFWLGSFSVCINRNNWRCIHNLKTLISSGTHLIQNRIHKLFKIKQNRQLTYAPDAHNLLKNKSATLALAHIHHFSHHVYQNATWTRHEGQRSLSQICSQSYTSTCAKPPGPHHLSFSFQKGLALARGPPTNSSAIVTCMHKN